MASYQRVEDMPVFQVFYGAALEVERITREFANDFRWLRNQMLRSSESVISNMTEGFYAQYSTEYVHSLYRSMREAEETITHTKYARDVDQLDSSRAEDVLRTYEQGLGQLGALIGSIERKIARKGKGKPPPTVRVVMATYEV